MKDRPSTITEGKIFTPMLATYYQELFDDILEYIKCEEEWIVKSKKWKERWANEEKSSVKQTESPFIMDFPMPAEYKKRYGTDAFDPPEEEIQPKDLYAEFGLEKVEQEEGAYKIQVLNADGIIWTYDAMPTSTVVRDFVVKLV
jgi:hypothetical protein